METAGAGGGEKPTRMHGDPLQGGGVTLQCDAFILPGVRALWLEDRRLAHHGNGRPSRKNPAVGPSSASVAAHTTLAAPSATGRPPGPPMSVATQPGQTAFTRMPSFRSSAASRFPSPPYWSV